MKKQEILTAAIRLAKKTGYNNLRCVDVAESAGVAPSLILYYFKSINGLKATVVKTAREKKILIILAQAILLKDGKVKKISKELRQAAIEAVNNQ